MKIYTTSNCPKCFELKQFLELIGANFQVEDMTTSESRTHLQSEGVFTTAAPVLEMNDGTFWDTKKLFNENGMLSFEAKNELIKLLEK